MKKYLTLFTVALLVGFLSACDGQPFNPLPGERPIIPLPPPPPTNPSPTAAKGGWPNSPMFGDPTKYGAPGYYGDWKARARVLTIATEGPVTPVCGRLYQLEAGNSAVVPNCQAPPQYAALCDANYTELRTRCEVFCAKTQVRANPCVNWQLRPHVYEEWGCVGGPAPPGVVAVVPRQFCRTIETCTCTSSIE